MPSKLRIAVKYCGGCNPRYDRPEVVNKLKRDLPGAQIVPAGENQADYVVVLCGCRSACAQHAHLTGEQGKSVLTCGESYPSLLETLRTLTGVPEPPG
jgi:4-hydroxybutyrate CoA-transferase